MSYVMRRYLTDQQQKLLLSTIKTRAVSVLVQRDYAWISLLLLTGMRIGEFSLLTVKQARLALTSGWLFIPGHDRKGSNVRAEKVRTLTPAEKHRISPHNKRIPDHQVPMTKPMLAAVRDLLSLHEAFGGDGADDSPLVISRKHGRLAIRSYQLRMTFWCRAAGIEHASPHWLRHTRAMQIMRRSQAKDPRGVAQALLGHRSIASTGVYTAVTKEDLVAAVNAVDGTRLRRGQVAKAFSQGVV